MTTSKSSAQDKKDDRLAQAIAVNAELNKEINELRKLSGIEGASLFDLAAELHRRFGVYTSFTNVEPTDGDIHPLTASEMTRYEHGHAYQLFKRSRNWVDTRNYEEDHENKQRLATEHKLRRDQGFTNPMQPTYQRADNTEAPVDRTSYEWRTSVHGETETQAGTTVSNGETVAPQAATEREQREAYRQSVAQTRYDADAEAKARAEDYRRRTEAPAFEDAPSPEDNLSEETAPVETPAEPQVNATVKEVLEMEGLAGEVIKENDIFGQQIR